MERAGWVRGAAFVIRFPLLSSARNPILHHSVLGRPASVSWSSDAPFLIAAMALLGVGVLAGGLAVRLR